MSPSLRRTAAVPLLLALAGPAGAQAIGQGDGKLVTLQGIRSATVAPAGLGFAALALSERADDDPEDGALFFEYLEGQDAAQSVVLTREDEPPYEVCA